MPEETGGVGQLELFRLIGGREGEYPLPEKEKKKLKLGHLREVRQVQE